MKPESCEILFQKFPYTTLIRSVLRFHMTHSQARPFERDSPHQNLKLRLSHRGWPKRCFLGELSRFGPTKPASQQASQPASQPASKPASQPASEPASKPASTETEQHSRKA